MKIFLILDTNKNSWWNRWNVFNKNINFSQKEQENFNLLLNAIKEKDYNNFTEILCILQVHEKVYEFIKDSLEKSDFFNKNYFNKNTKESCIQKITNLIKEHREPLVENDNILYVCEILNSIYYHLIIKLKENPKHIQYIYQQSKIQITYEKNQYDIDEKKINEILSDFKNLSISTYEDFKKTSKLHEKYYKDLVKFTTNF